MYHGPKLMKCLWFPHQRCLAFTEIVSLIVFSLKICLLSITLLSTRSVIYNLDISSVNKGFTVQFWSSASSQLFQQFYRGLTDLNLKGNSVDEVQEETKSASLCNLFFPLRFPEK